MRSLDWLNYDVAWSCDLNENYTWYKIKYPDAFSFLLVEHLGIQKYPEVRKATEVIPNALFICDINKQ